VADRHQLRVLLNGTRKPVVFVSYDISGCVDALAMAETVAGGREALSARPFLACYVNAASGLLHNRDSLQKLLLLAERNVPALYIPGGIAGLSGPATVAGSVAMINAGVLTGLVLSQLKRPGAPFVTKAWGGGGLDMRTMVYGYAGPDSRRAALRLAHYYDLPSFALAGASDAKLPDTQAAAEAALTLAVDTLAGADMIHDLGYLESGLSGSLSQLVLCDEVVGWLRHYLTKVELDADSLAVDVIDEVGPDGRFLPHAHTKRTYRQQWYPTLFDRQTHAGWQATGAEPLGGRAAARVDGILAAHAAPSLPGDVDRRLAAIVAAAEGSLT
jgi:trimethylamine--corrinoid protein Co-methyltransferase